jgi:hypothetical protein
LEAAEQAGGEGGLVAYLVRQATINPTAFLALLGRVLPLQIAGDTNNPVNVTVSWRRPSRPDSLLEDSQPKYSRPADPAPPGTRVN